MRASPEIQGDSQEQVGWQTKDHAAAPKQGFIGPGGPGGAVNTEELAKALETRTHLLAPKYTKYYAKSCPKCHRLFPDWMAVCAVDGSVLEVPISQVVAENHAAIASGEGQKMTRHMCVRCERRFSDQVTYCGYDGTKLIKDTPQAAGHAKVYLVCQSCGFGTEDGRSCRCAMPQEIELNPACLKPHPGGFVSLRCPSCSRVSTGISPVCACDGSLMMPVDVLARHTFPDKGWGQAEKMCGRCGDKFGASLRCCPNDGQPLKWVD